MLRVIGRSFLTLHEDGKVRVDQIANRFGISYVVEGSVRQWNGRLRATVRLVRAGDRSVIWAETYDRVLADLAGVERDIARRICQAVALKLMPADVKALGRAGTL